MIGDCLRSAGGLLGWAGENGIGLLTIAMLIWTIRSTRKNGKDQARAYLHAERAEISGQSITLTVENSGQTPARWFSIEYAAFVRKRSEPLEYRKRQLTDGGKKRWNGLGGNSDTTIGLALPEMNDLLAEADGKREQFHCFGVVRYKTFFNEIRESEFAFFQARGGSMALNKMTKSTGDLRVYMKVDRFRKRRASADGVGPVST